MIYTFVIRGACKYWVNYLSIDIAIKNYYVIIVIKGQGKKDLTNIMMSLFISYS